MSSPCLHRAGEGRNKKGGRSAEVSSVLVVSSMDPELVGPDLQTEMETSRRRLCETFVEGGADLPSSSKATDVGPLSSSSC